MIVPHVIAPICQVERIAIFGHSRGYFEQRGEPLRWPTGVPIGADYPFGPGSSCVFVTLKNRPRRTGREGRG